MDQIRLGGSGLHVSRVCLGMMSYGNDSDRPWALDEEAAEPIIRRAVEGGITFFDTADVYSRGASEVATGRLVGKMLRSDEVVIATKVHRQMTTGPNGRETSRSRRHCAAHRIGGVGPLRGGRNPRAHCPGHAAEADPRGGQDRSPSRVLRDERG